MGRMEGRAGAVGGFNSEWSEQKKTTTWFGGGTDITPAYIDKDDMRHFHGTYKGICDRNDPAWHPRLKKWADEYFYIKHRGERRGLGGIFFDVFNEVTPERHFQFSKDCMMAVTDAYCPIIEKNRNKPFTEVGVFLFPWRINRSMAGGERGAPNSNARPVLRPGSEVHEKTTSSRQNLFTLKKYNK